MYQTLWSWKILNGLVVFSSVEQVVSTENDKITSTPQTSGHSFEEISVEVETRSVVQNFRWNQTIKSTAVTLRGLWTPDQNYIVESYLLSSSCISNWQLKKGPQFGFLLFLSDFLDCAVQFRWILLTFLVCISGEKNRTDEGGVL